MVAAIGFMIMSLSSYAGGLIDISLSVFSNSQIRVLSLGEVYPDELSVVSEEN